jgi:hypothetical protein
MGLWGSKQQKRDINLENPNEPSVPGQVYLSEEALENVLKTVSSQQKTSSKKQQNSESVRENFAQKYRQHSI